jgi:predicted DCC family thiol-disulfide oxidoreductase YuxK
VGGTAPRLPSRIVLYDGVCGLCHRTVAWLLSHDQRRALHFAPLQGETASRLRAAHPEIPEELETIVYVEDGRVFFRSRALAQVLGHLPQPYSLGRVFRFVPAFLLDWAYRLVARARYRVWGRYETCRRPTTEDQAQLLP